MTDSLDSYYISYEEFSLKKRAILSNSKKVGSLYIYNDINTFYPPLTDESELPVNGIFLNDIGDFKKFVNLKQFYLEGLFLKELPDFFISFKKLERMQICFSRSTDVKKALSILLKMPSLNYLDINSSRLSEDKRDYLIKELTSNGIKVFDYFTLHEPKNRLRTH